MKFEETQFSPYYLLNQDLHFNKIPRALVYTLKLKKYCPVPAPQWIKHKWVCRGGGRERRRSWGEFLDELFLHSTCLVG